MEVPRKAKRVPRKQLFVYQIDQLLKLSEAQLKVWLYHYRREGGGEERRSWASRITVGGATGFSRPTITHARTWLVEHGWLTVVGFRPTQHGGHPVREYRCLFPVAQGKPSDPLTDPQGKTSNPSINSQGTGSDPLQCKASDPSKVKPAAPEVKGPWEVTATPIPSEVILATNSFGVSQSFSQSVGETSASPQPPSSENTEQQTVVTNEEQTSGGKGMAEEDRLQEIYRVHGYPMLEGGEALYPNIVIHFYQLAGADRVRSDRNRMKDMMAAWSLLQEHRFDEVLFVMRMVLKGDIPFYRGKRRPWDFFWFAEHYPHARVLAEETFVAREVAKDETTTSDCIDAPWTYELGGWTGIPDSWSGDWLTCIHEVEPGKPAYMADGIEACYLCGCPKGWKPKDAASAARAIGSTREADQL